MIVTEIQEGFNARMDDIFCQNPYPKISNFGVGDWRNSYWFWEYGWNKAVSCSNGRIDLEIIVLKEAYELQSAYKKVNNDVIGKILADRDLSNVNKPGWAKKLFKFRSWQYGILLITLFQEKRYELGFTFDHYEQPPLLAISLIFIHFEITF